eukprot:TRINITY_DN4192_c0_g1_i2.p2 TRINITY_DN4192_c0_g1~~TRINITY_DN4192_c0_g1_i2.p2  ORF type:complete len:114 (+),score=28.84 TRINITY_DN4192_c0_g1_i2:107-448(+)
MEKKNEPPNALINLVQSLSEAIVYTESSNFDTNKKLWNNYAKDWKKDVDWVKKMVQNLPDGENLLLDSHLSHIGDEWSDKKSLEQTLEDFLYPSINIDSLVAEIGSGGDYTII